MKKFILLIMIMIALSNFSFGATIGELFRLKDHSKETVVQGEAIGDVMIRGEGAWINIKDKTGAIGIWAPKAQAEKITVTGNYKHIGDRIETEGTFNKQCLTHGGDTDIHAVNIKIVEKGYERDIAVKPHEISWAIITLILLIVLYLLRRYLALRQYKPKKESDTPEV
ncbi:hypothetical protein ACFLZ2_05685 [Candidatus Margulisiibacteriota bacterium]